MRLFKLILAVPLLFSVVACGGSSGSDGFSGTIGQNGQKLVVMDPADNAVFAPGETISFSLRTENFTLAVPNDRRDQSKHHIDTHEVDVDALAEAAEAAGLVEGEEEQHAEHDTSMEEESVHDTSDGHSHDDSSTHPHATEGHYHVYLNAAADSDEHTTQWVTSLDYTLPEDLPAGSHSLRFELRDNDHVKVGAETIYFFSVSAEQ